MFPSGLWPQRPSPGKTGGKRPSSEQPSGEQPSGEGGDSSDGIRSGPVEPTGEQPAQTPRPIIGLALGGGAARGWAHIGVVKVLEKAGYAPDIIAGTSIGAVVGGCYAAGGMEKLFEFATQLNKRRMFALMDFNFGGSGLINGSRLARLLNDGLGAAQMEDLPRRFVSIATELGTGHEIWLSKGNAVEAMRASYAMPGIFKPVRVHGRWLIDGALVNPVPVSVCRAFGARLVIAVNLSTDVFGRGTIVRAHDPVNGQMAPHRSADMDGAEAGAEAGLDENGRDNAAHRLLHRQLMGGPGNGGMDGPPGISTVMVDAFNIVQDRISRSRLAGDPPDVMIGPYLNQIGLFDFHRAEEAIALGEEAAERALPDIERAALILGG